MASLLVMLMVGYLAIKSRKPVAEENSTPLSQPEMDLPLTLAIVEEHKTLISARLILPGDNANAEEMLVETTVTEGSWATEMRELRELTIQDPDAALTLAAEQPTREERDEAVREVCLQLARLDPARALTNAWRLQLGKDSDGSTDYMALENISKRWAETDLAAAIAWVSEQKSGENDDRRDWILKGLASVSSKFLPTDAARLVSEQILPGQVQLQAALAVLKQWAALDFDSASAWAEQFPEGGIRDSAREQLTQLFSRTEAESSPP
ncbi:MAG: hypothetical protein H7Y43_09075 [Akkermansiaceae bacterium]|nr:hypothetical protein [Verrucomicrobiales bacterium]